MNKTTCQVELEELRLCLFPIKQAQSFLEEKYPEWTQEGKDYAVKEAAQYLRKAHARLNKIYVDTIYPADPSTEPEPPPASPEPWIGNCPKCRTAYRTIPKSDTSRPLFLNCGRPVCDGIVRFTPIDGIKEPECDPAISNLQETLPLPSELPEDYRYATQADNSPCLRACVILDARQAAILNEWFEARCKTLKTQKWEGWNPGDQVIRTICVQIDSFSHKAFNSKNSGVSIPPNASNP